MTAPDPKVTKLDTEDEVLREAGKRALIAEREENKELKKQLKELKDAKDVADAATLSNEQKAIKRAEKAEALVASYQTKETVSKLRADIAKELEISEHADLLFGDDADSLRAHGEKLKAALGPKTPAPNPYLGQEPGAKGDGDQEALSVLGFG